MNVTFADIVAIVAVIISIMAFIRATAALKMSLLSAEFIKSELLDEEENRDHGKNGNH
jgi:hypothetical protein